MNSLTSLPERNATMTARHQACRDTVNALIRRDGPLSFARYMETVLYGSGVGYYSADSTQFGRQGDFITAPELSPLFAQCLAQQVTEGLSRLSDRGAILEIGPGRGQLAIDLLQALQTANTLPKTYYLYDMSPALREAQQQRLSTQLPAELYQRVVWLDGLSQLHDFEGVVIANEVMDAMPVQRFRVTEAGMAVCRVILQAGELCETWSVAPLANPEEQRLFEHAINEVPDHLPRGYESEVNPGLANWLLTLNRVMHRGLVLLIDYGFPAREYYHPDRCQGTLMCHYQHTAHSDYYRYPGLQDMTAHVDFTAVARAACSAGFEVAGFNNQATFLIQCGLTDLIMALEGDAVTQFKRNQAVKMLTLPSEMGELFKVMALTKALDHAWLGFNKTNAIARL